jgi:hypothetical protein
MDMTTNPAWSEESDKCEEIVPSATEDKSSQMRDMVQGDCAECSQLFPFYIAWEYLSLFITASTTDQEATS